MSERVVMMKLPITSCPQLWLLNHLNSFHGGMFKFNAKFDADLLFSLGHFECYGHTVHTLTQRHLLPPLTSTSEIAVHTGVFQSTVLGCQVTLMLHKSFLLH